ncbi:MAG: cyclic nucleotide-binding domain-containing protein, partial [Anaerolineales bacterium]
MEAQQALSLLKAIPMFDGLDERGEQELIRLIPFVNERLYQTDEMLLQQHRIPERLILIIAGSVNLSRETETIGTQNIGDFGPGSVLGRSSMQVGDYQLINARALEPTRVLYIPFRELVRAYDNSSQLRDQLKGSLNPTELVTTLRYIPLFQNLQQEADLPTLYRVAIITHEQVYSNGEWLFRQGEIGDRLIYVLEGQVRLTQVDKDGLSHQIGALKPGDAAGETSLMVGDFHDVTATGYGTTRVLYIDRQEFAQLLQTETRLREKLDIRHDIHTRSQLRSFDWLRDDEWIMTVFQRHWTRLFRQIALPILLLMLLFPLFTALALQTGILEIVIAAVLAIPFIVIMGVVLWQYVNWRDDFFVITTQRVVHIERAWPFSTQYEETSLDHIEDIHETQYSWSANMFNYGNLILETAGETVDIDMDYVPDSTRLREIIAQQIERSRARNLLRARGQIREMLSRQLQEIEAAESPPTTVETPVQPSPFNALLPFTAIRDYLFPNSWQVSEDGNTIFWRRFWLPGFFRYLPIFALLVFITLGGLLFLSNLPEGTNFFSILFIWLGAEAVVMGILLWFIEDWRNDYFQLTQNKIIQVDQRPLLLGVSRREAPIDRIQNLGFEIPSTVARFFDYGHVKFETAGTEG